MGIKKRKGPLPELLEKTGVSVKELAAEVGVQDHAINRWTEGKTADLHRNKFKAIAARLGVEIDDLRATVAVQRDIRGLLQFRECLADLNCLLSIGYISQRADAQKWAPKPELILSVIAGLQEYLRECDAVPAPANPPPKKLLPRLPRRPQSAKTSQPPEDSAAVT